ncbi:MAG: hypothetical protein HYX68_07055 [Planctomycetes bacterium]|nr:hypothetical protein [Planctomycetota bacterium]
MAWVEILPRYASLFRRVGRDSAASFLAWTGVLVNQHRHRQVEQVGLANELPSLLAPRPGEEGRTDRFFIKKEYAVTWRDRLRNAWHGFGWCATSVREGAILQALREAGIGCPDVAALGEQGRAAFVVLSDESARAELRAILPTLSPLDQGRLAEALGRELARMHDAGFEHPDLFAKHILVSPDPHSLRFCILDWQRGRRRRVVRWSVRCRDLALLDATLHVALASDLLRLRCLRAYCRATKSEAPPLARLALEIRRRSEHLGRSRSIREVGGLAIPKKDQQFVPLCEGRLLVVRSFLDRAVEEKVAWLSRLMETNPVTGACCLNLGEQILEVEIHGVSQPPMPRSMPVLAHTLFRLQRFGVPAPRLLAVGYPAGGAFVLVESRRTMPLEQALAKAGLGRRRRMMRQAGRLVRLIHDAGYRLPPGDAWERRLGVVSSSDEVVLVRVEPLLRDSATWREKAPLEFARPNLRLSRGEQVRFLLGYLGQKRLQHHDRAWIFAFSVGRDSDRVGHSQPDRSSQPRTGERQSAS